MGGNVDNSSILKSEMLQSQFSLATTQYNTALSNYKIMANSAQPDILKMKSYLEQIDKLNNELTDLYYRINNTFASVNLKNNTASKISDKEQSLKTTYLDLLEQKKQISKLLKESETLESKHSDSSLIVDSHYMFYKVLIIVALILIFFIIKQFVLYSIPKSQMTGGGRFSFYDLRFNFVLIILLLFLAQTFNHSAGYILWAIFVLTYLLMKFNV